MTSKPSTPEAGADVGDPPPHLGPELAALWVELRADLPADAGLTAADRHVFEVAVRLTSKSRAGTLVASETTELRRTLDMLALTPAGRERLQWRGLIPRVN